MPLVVAAKIDNALQLVALNDAAASTGLVVGMPLATARAMLPALEVIDADPVADGKTLNAIADWCDRFTPLVALDGTRRAVSRHHRLRASVRRRSRA